jgi:hypothetical protein
MTTPEERPMDSLMSAPMTPEDTETLQTLVDEARKAQNALAVAHWNTNGPAADAAVAVLGVIDRLCAALSAPAGEWVLVPKKLTAENGAKAALIGEFAESHLCLDGDGDEVLERVPVSWTTIKEIHKRVVELFAAAPAESATPSAGWAERLYREVHQIAVEFREVCHNTDGKYPTDRDCNRKMHDLLLRLLGEDVKASIAYHITAPSSPVPDASKAQTDETKAGDVYDDTQPVKAALSDLAKDGYATDRQRSTARIALAEINRLESSPTPSPDIAALRERAEKRASYHEEWAAAHREKVGVCEESIKHDADAALLRDLAAALPSTALRDATVALNTAIDAYWNADPQDRHDGLVKRICEAQRQCKAALSSPSKGER